MKTQLVLHATCIAVSTVFLSCSADTGSSNNSTLESTFPNIAAQFEGTIDLNNLPQYSTQSVPFYITKDNTMGNPITDAGATLGRVLFYDKNLSSDGSVSCSSCHVQSNGFSDLNDASQGVNEDTARHSMRLINSRFSRERRFFWDERAASLEAQTTQPIRDHGEMGFSGTSGAPAFNDLITKLNNIGYYPEFFQLAFGSAAITEAKIQLALAQFVRSIQSFDSKFDLGRVLVPNNGASFPNYTANENAGKSLFLLPPPAGAGCDGCHQAPEFDIDPNSGNNGVVGVIAGGTDIENTRAPSLRDVVRTGGATNGAFMHDASLTTLEQVVSHYNNGISLNAGLDLRLAPGGSPQNLNLTAIEQSQLVSFLKTLSGSDVYTNPIWSDPF